MDLDTLLAMPLSNAVAAYQPITIPDGAIRAGEPGYRVRLSHSTMMLMHGCERKFQKQKLLLCRQPRESSPAMSFGSGYGAGAQHYMLLRSAGHSVEVALASAQYEAWLHYHPLEEDANRYEERVVACLAAAVPFHERMLEEWEIAVFNGKPAVELSFCLDIDDTYYFVGYIDLVLKHRKSGRYAITDYKSTSIRSADLTPYYKLSDQTIGYSIVLDAIAGSELTDYDVNYWVMQMGTAMGDHYSPMFHDFSYPKTARDRFEWFLKVYLDVGYINSLTQLEVYPRRGNHCTSWNRTCQFFEECQFTTLDQPGFYVPDTIDYDFRYNLNDLFAQHQARL